MRELLVPYSDTIASGRTEEAGRQIADLLSTYAVRESLLARGQRGVFARNDTPENAATSIRRAHNATNIDPYFITSISDPENIIGVATAIEDLSLRKGRTMFLPTVIERKLKLSRDITPEGANLFAWTHPNYEEELLIAYKELAEKQLTSFTPTRRIHTPGGSFEIAQVGWTLECAWDSSAGMSEENMEDIGFKPEGFGMYDEGEFKWKLSPLAFLYTLTASRKIQSPAAE